MIIDCHGHYTTEPKDLHRFRKDQTEAVKTRGPPPPRAGLKMSDDEIRASIEGAQLKLPAMIHVSGCCNPAQHTTGSYYLNADTMAVMQLILSDLFKDFPKLRLIVPHGGGAVPFHWGRFRGIALDNKRPELAEIMGNNIFFDTCVYHQPGIDLLTKVVPVDNILFASEMVGAVKGIDPRTGNYFDDTKRYVDGTSNLSAADKQKVFEGNALKVYPRLKAQIEKQTRGNA